MENAIRKLLSYLTILTGELGEYEHNASDFEGHLLLNNIVEINCPSKDGTTFTHIRAPIGNWTH